MLNNEEKRGPVRRLRKCESCCPDLTVPFYEIEPDEWRCDNCRHTVTIVSRRPRFGNAQQCRAVERVEDLLRERFEIEDKTEPDHRARGVRWLFARPRHWYDDALSIRVGVRGALLVHVLDRKNTERRGRRAWTWLEVAGR